MHANRISLALFAWLLFVLGATNAITASALTIDTISAWNGSSDYSIFGGSASSPTKSYGQVFSLLQTETLNDVTFILRDSGNSNYRPMTFGFYLMSWDGAGSHPAGSILFSNASNTTSGSGTFENFVFNTNGLNLTAGDYIAFVSVIGQDGLLPQSSPTGIGFASMAGTYADSYNGGRFVFDTFAAQQFLDLTTNAWSDFGAIDSAFKLNFAGNVRPPIPEPETYALMLAGLSLLGFGIVSRSRQQKVPA